MHRFLVVIEQAEGNLSAYSPTCLAAPRRILPWSPLSKGGHCDALTVLADNSRTRPNDLPSGSGTPHSNRQAFVARRTSEPSHQT